MLVILSFLNWFENYYINYKVNTLTISAVYYKDDFAKKTKTEERIKTVHLTLFYRHKE